MSNSTENEFALSDLREAAWRMCRAGFTESEIKDTVEIAMQQWRDACEKENQQ